VTSDQPLLVVPSSELPQALGPLGDGSEHTTVGVT
jgi:hypothetical protein